MHGDVHITPKARRATFVPRQLPLPANRFVDRKAQLRQLDTLTTQASGQGVPVVLLAGPPGVGKTALAVHWAHRARVRFPDGDLYVSMHGHAPGARAQASQALDTILRTLGVATERIPPGQGGPLGTVPIRGAWQALVGRHRRCTRSGAGATSPTRLIRQHDRGDQSKHAPRAGRA
ncbi:MAG TPA: ATP-binding protein [Nocardiopsis listeri]|nr:ATP-binding protein [Nocardiopsis listeri]